MTYTWSDIENALNEDINDTYGSEDMYIDEFFNVEELKDFMQAFDEKDFVEWFTEKYRYTINKMVARYFETLSYNWDNEHTANQFARYIYNNLD